MFTLLATLPSLSCAFARLLLVGWNPSTEPLPDDEAGAEGGISAISVGTEGVSGRGEESDLSGLRWSSGSFGMPLVIGRYLLVSERHSVFIGHCVELSGSF